MDLLPPSVFRRVKLLPDGYTRNFRASQFLRTQFLRMRDLHYALRSLKDYRYSFATQVRQASDRLLENNDGVLRLDHAPLDKSTAA
jgi:hypothetical protein